MNGLFLSNTDEPWEQLATVAKAIDMKVSNLGYMVDKADYELAFKPYVKKFMVMAKIEAARRISGEILTEYMKLLQKELRDAEQGIADIAL